MHSFFRPPFALTPGGKETCSLAANSKAQRVPSLPSNYIDLATKTFVGTTWGALRRS